MLYRYLAHISCYVDSVYEYEVGTGMMLSQCISECKSFSLQMSVVFFL
jgi:hypothetical protein